MNKRYILPISQRNLPETVGTKAINLRKLKNRGLLVPNTYICTWHAYQEFKMNGTDLRSKLANEFQDIIDPQKLYAIRSSANIEDGLDYSFAGQFKSFLEQQGLEQVLAAVWSIWQSAQSPEITTYLDRIQHRKETLKMAVIIQDMVKPLVSGVAFSKNPITLLDEVVVEAVPGSGDRLVQDGVTPSRWIDKWGSWIQRSESEFIDDAIIREVVSQTRWISKSYKMDVDLEWVYDGEQIFWVQMRKITAQHSGQIYSNRISKEMLPGMIKPLVWSVAIPVHSHHWHQIIQRVLGKKGLDFSNLIHPFYYRAYFNMGAFGQVFDLLGMPRESLEMMMGLLPADTQKPKMKMPRKVIKHVPRISAFLVYLWTFGKKAQISLSELQAEFRAAESKSLNNQDEFELSKNIDHILTIYSQSSYYTLVVQLLMHIYHRFLKNHLEDLGIDIHQFNLTENMPELGPYDPAAGMQRLVATFLALPPDIQESIRLESYSEFCQRKDIEELQNDIQEFLEVFGHISESTNDFSSPPWRENPEIVLRLMSNSQLQNHNKIPLVQYKDIQVAGMKRISLNILYQRARLFRYYREAITTVFTKSLCLLRSNYLALGKLFEKNKILDDPQAIFYLTKEEIKEIVEKGKITKHANELALKRKKEMEECRDITLPEIIHGEVAPPVIHQSVKKLIGVASSRGYYRGPVKVIRSINEFEKLEAGDVLVIPYSDVSWTPLFAKAGAVIAESGGLLSHSSIIAREYQIPAVVSVNGALQLSDGKHVSIDGYKGEIQILDFQTA